MGRRKLQTTVSRYTSTISSHTHARTRATAPAPVCLSRCEKKVKQNTSSSSAFAITGCSDQSIFVRWSVAHTHTHKHLTVIIVISSLGGALPHFTFRLRYRSGSGSAAAKFWNRHHTHFTNFWGKSRVSLLLWHRGGMSGCVYVRVFDLMMIDWVLEIFLLFFACLLWAV